MFLNFQLLRLRILQNKTPAKVENSSSKRRLFKIALFSPQRSWFVPWTFPHWNNSLDPAVDDALTGNSDSQWAEAAADGADRSVRTGVDAARWPAEAWAVSDFVSEVTVGMAQRALDLSQHRAEGSALSVFQSVVVVDERILAVSLAVFAALKGEFRKKCEDKFMRNAKTTQRSAHRLTRRLRKSALGLSDQPSGFYQRRSFHFARRVHLDFLEWPVLLILLNLLFPLPLHWNRSLLQSVFAVKRLPTEKISLRALWQIDSARPRMWSRGSHRFEVLECGWCLDVI